MIDKRGISFSKALKYPFNFVMVLFIPLILNFFSDLPVEVLKIKPTDIAAAEGGPKVLTKGDSSYFYNH